MQRKMTYMSPPQELIVGPLTTEELAARYRALCADPLYADVPGKFELNIWGRVLMSPPPSNYHGALQIQLAQRLLAALGGRVIAEASILTSMGVFVADVAWMSYAFSRAHGFETPYAKAPELCVEIVSPANSVKEMNEKRDAYLAAGAREVWIVYPESRRCELYGRDGPLESSAYAVDLTGLFDD
jgi:Uma2 family endonuclease